MQSSGDIDLQQLRKLRSYCGSNAGFVTKHAGMTNDRVRLTCYNKQITSGLPFAANSSLQEHCVNFYAFTENALMFCYWQAACAAASRTLSRHLSYTTWFASLAMDCWQLVFFTLALTLHILLLLLRMCRM
jgi:hypothetical protein